MSLLYCIVSVWVVGHFVQSEHDQVDAGYHMSHPHALKIVSDL